MVLEVNFPPVVGAIPVAPLSSEFDDCVSRVPTGGSHVDFPLESEPLWPPVSVIIPAYNAEPYIQACLDSVYSQGVPVEVIVVDDGSTDATADRARSYPDVILHRQANSGPAKARNVAMRMASHTIVAFLDADDIWPPGSLAKRLSLLMQHPSAALVFGDCQQFSEQRYWPRTLFAEMHLGSSAWGTGPFVPRPYAALLKGNFITTGSVVARRCLILAIDGFDETLRLVEDLDLWLRIARRHPIAWTPSVCLLRRRHAENTSRDLEAMTLAYLEVLQRQRTALEAELTAEEHALLARRYAGEGLQMMEYALCRRDLGAAWLWGWRAVRSCPTCRTLLSAGRAGLRSLLRVAR